MHNSYGKQPCNVDANLLHYLKCQFPYVDEEYILRIIIQNNNDKMACERELRMDNLQYHPSSSSEDLLTHQLLAKLKVSSPPSSSGRVSASHTQDMESLSQGMSNDVTPSSSFAAISNGTGVDQRPRVEQRTGATVLPPPVRPLPHSVSTPDAYYTAVYQQYVGVGPTDRPTPTTAPVTRPDFEPFMNMQRNLSNISHGIPNIPCQSRPGELVGSKSTPVLLSSTTGSACGMPEVGAPDPVSQRKPFHVTISKACSNTGQKPEWNISIRTPPPEVTHADFPLPPNVQRHPVDRSTVQPHVVGYHHEPSSHNMLTHFSPMVGTQSASRPGNFPVTLPNNAALGEYRSGGGSSSSCSPSQSSTGSHSQAGTPQHAGMGGMIPGHIYRSPGTPPRQFGPGSSYSDVFVSSPSHLGHVAPSYTTASGASSAVSSSMWMSQPESTGVPSHMSAHPGVHPTLPARVPVSQPSSQQEAQGPLFYSEVNIQVMPNPAPNQYKGYVHPNAGAAMPPLNPVSQNEDINNLYPTFTHSMTLAQGTVPIYERTRSNSIPPNHFNQYAQPVGMTAGPPMTPSYYYQAHVPSFMPPMPSMSPVDVPIGHPRSRSGSLAGPEEPAYTQALVLHQRARLEKLNCDVAEECGQLEALRQEVKSMEIATSQRRKKRINPIVTATDLAKLREENRKLNVDVDLLTRQVDWITQGQSLLGVVDRNSQRNFYQDIYEGATGSIQTSDESLRSSQSSGSATPAVRTTTPVSPRTPPARPPPPVPSHPPAPPYLRRASPEDEEGDNWNCAKCTFSNHPLLEVCEQCELPRVRFGTTIPGLLQH